MKITIEHYGIELTWDNKRGPILDETTIDEAFGAYIGLLMTSGWGMETIEYHIIAMAEELKEYDDKEEEKV